MYSAFTYSELHTRTTVRICCNNTDLVHVNGHDRTITVILAKHFTRLTDDESSMIRNMLEQFQISYNFNCIYILYIVHWLDNKVFVTHTRCKREEYPPYLFPYYEAYSESKYRFVVKKIRIRFRIKFYCDQILHSSNYFSTYSPQLLRHLY